MPKFPQIVTFGVHPTKNYMAMAHTPDAALGAIWCAAIPGAKEQSNGLFDVPVECIDMAADFIERFGLSVTINNVHTSLSDSHTFDRVPRLAKATPKAAYEFQVKGADRLLYNGRFMLNYEMGLGKTLSSILALKTYKPKHTLIVCPAIVRLSWLDEMNKWWKKHPEIVIVDKGKVIPDGPITIVSYELLPGLIQKKIKWDSIFMDESHYAMNAGSRRAVSVRKVIMSNPQSLIGFLTATPITSEPMNLHNQLDILWPGRLGTTADFGGRYCTMESNEWGSKYAGLNESNAGELRDRLTHMALRVTKHEVADIMPPFVVTPIRIRPKKELNVKELTNQLLRTDRHNAKVDRIIGKFGGAKRQEAVEWTRAATQTGEKVCVLTYFRDTARNIVAGLSNQNKTGLKIFHFDGATSIPKRRAIIKTALKTKNSVLVCTMSSVKEGINTMAGFDNALLAELYYTPGLMTQVLGRFHRLSGACNVTILVFEGSWEEIIAYRLQEKMRQSGMLQRSAVAEDALNMALDEDETEDEAFDSMRRIASERVEESVYA